VDLFGNITAAFKKGFEKKAHLEILSPSSKAGTKIPLCFNPTELQISKQNTFAEVAIPGLMAPPIQFVRGASEKLTFDALVDTSDTMKDVRKEYVQPIRDLMKIDSKLHAPPLVRLVWDDQPGFTAVLESLNITYTLFSDAGVPLRAKLAITLKQFTTVEEQVKEAPKHSPDVEKTYVVQRGDTLSGIAEKAYGDPAPWREIARANGIDDPRALAPGRVLTIPRLTVSL
jgi:nucleoid-associated protein YgaU